MAEVAGHIQDAIARSGQIKRATAEGEVARDCHDAVQSGSNLEMTAV